MHTNTHKNSSKINKSVELSINEQKCSMNLASVMTEISLKRR